MENVINYKLDQFEGPLDLLLTLIIKNKINIDDIPIVLLCDQYMTYIEQNLDAGMDVAAEFLYMASELMLIKSRTLLPRNAEIDEDPRLSLRDAVIEYQKTKLAASELSDLYVLFGGRVEKEQDDISIDRTYVAPHDIELLRSALIHALSMSDNKLTLKKPDNAFEEIIHQPHVPVHTVTAALLSRLRSAQPLYLDQYFLDSRSHSEQIAKFLSILELLKVHVVSLLEEASQEAVAQTGAITNLASHTALILQQEPNDDLLQTLTEYA